jgi:hypothetical protein
MKPFENCDDCQFGMCDLDAQKIICVGCDGTEATRFHKITEQSIQDYAQALEINDDWCLPCWDRDNDKLPVHYRDAEFCPYCGKPWTDNIDSETILKASLKNNVLNHN